jgi:hypothetical protein
MPVSNGHRLKPSKLHSNSFPFFQGHPKIIPPLNNMENSIFPPPLGHPSSDSPAVNANPCPSVTGIASNRQNYIQIASLFPGPSENHSALKLHGKMDFSTAARSPVVRFTRGKRQSMPVSNGHRLKPSKLHSNSFPFFQGHPKIIPP